MRLRCLLKGIKHHAEFKIVELQLATNAYYSQNRDEDKVLFPTDHHWMLVNHSLRTERPEGSNDIGMLAWKMSMKTPEYPQGRDLILISNDVTFQAGSFGVKEDPTQQVEVLRYSATVLHTLSLSYGFLKWHGGTSQSSILVWDFPL